MKHAIPIALALIVVAGALYCRGTSRAARTARTPSGVLPAPRPLAAPDPGPSGVPVEYPPVRIPRVPARTPPVGAMPAPATSLSLVARVDPVLVPIAWPVTEVIDPRGRALGSFFPNREKTLGTRQPGTYTVRASTSGWEASPGDFTIDAPDRRSAVAAGRIEVLLSPTNAYRGAVVDRVTSAPVETFVATASYRETGATGEFFRELPERSSYPAGEFHFGGAPVEDGEVRFAIVAPGYLSGETDWLPCSRDTLIENLILALEPDDSPDGELVGHVTSSREPLEGARISVLRTADAGSESAPDEIQRIVLDGAGVHPVSYFAEDAPTPPKHLRSDAHGAYAGALRPGSYQLITEAPGHGPKLSQRIRVAAGERVEHDIELERGARLLGQVLVARDDPLALDELRVWIESQELDIDPEVDAQGHFEVLGLPEGSYRLTVRGGAGVNDLVKVQGFEVHGSGDHELSIRCGSLGEGVTLEGHATLPAEARGYEWLAGALPEGDPTALAFRSSTPDARGDFQFYGLPQGRILVALVGWSRAGQGSGLPLAPRRMVGLAAVEGHGASAQLEVRIEFEPSQVVVRRSESAVSAIDLRIVPSASAPHLEAEPGTGLDLLIGELTQIGRLEPGAEVRIDGLPPGSYELQWPENALPFELSSEAQLVVP